MFDQNVDQNIDQKLHHLLPQKWYEKKKPRDEIFVLNLRWKK